MKNYNEYTSKELLNIINLKEETLIETTPEYAGTISQADGWVEYGVSPTMLTEEAKEETIKKIALVNDKASIFNFFKLLTYQNDGRIHYKNEGDKTIMKISFEQ
jgi:hypothetical protein